MMLENRLRTFLPSGVTILEWKTDHLGSPHNF